MLTLDRVLIGLAIVAAIMLIAARKNPLTVSALVARDEITNDNFMDSIVGSSPAPSRYATGPIALMGNMAFMVPPPLFGLTTPNRGASPTINNDPTYCQGGC